MQIFDGYGKDHVDISTSPIFGDIFSSAGGVVFWSGQEIEWTTSGATRAVAPIASVLSASDSQYVYVISGDAVERIAVATGVASTFTTVDGPDYVMSLALTTEFVHVITSTTDGSVTDHRFDFECTAARRNGAPVRGRPARAG